MARKHDETFEDLSNKDLEPSTRRCCEACGGSGVIEEDIGEEYVDVECAACGGTGYED